MHVSTVMRLVNAAYALDRTLEQSLREIDRRALNALVLVKRHGTVLAGYGVIAQAFREQANSLKAAATDMRAILPRLIAVQMRAVQHQYYLASMNLEVLSSCGRNCCAGLTQSRDQWRSRVRKDEEEAHEILLQLLRSVEVLEARVAEQEYVVINARIEAALSESVGAPLNRVSADMGQAIQTVSIGIRQFHTILGGVLS
ncbi:hypothetical protein [Acidithiobacillus caldus]|uniref:Chemotaxis protein n=1 Tax=Acidithiobacillus caldus TaxID=33059 RepID=A0A1E7YPN4_9PROT|nr:hypothetical protein [Acidithiobacillus caldus]MBU2729624.1 hypothetical protein [Acidithiobacillus caldus]MBU2734235.1 hypothetical protein [Acidithiobacillus caldus ATCC 51756]MBU2746081.1 hypothetical protein [Acidithiobacillus caldus]MBU2779664.1 hypothetical protein [Acidithiobacillus caldus]OFC35661.1 hypothetical protein BAE28_10145 [Acidithiobacillus caldus]